METNILYQIGTTVEIKGDIYIRERDEENNTYTREYSSTNLDSKYSNIFYYIDTITLGFELYGIEFLIGTGKQDFKFKDFKCDSMIVQKLQMKFTVKPR